MNLYAVTNNINFTNLLCKNKLMRMQTLRNTKTIRSIFMCGVLNSSIALFIANNAK